MSVEQVLEPLSSDDSEVWMPRVRPIMSVPRVGFTEHFGNAMGALSPFELDGLRWCQGAFWGHSMQVLLEDAISAGVDWALTIDFDSMFKAGHVGHLFERMLARPDIDALCAMQLRRGEKETPIFTYGGFERAEIDEEPIQVSTAHFGLTVIRLDRLKDLPKPWFQDEPNKNGEWREGRIDDDIWFWRMWRQHGRNVYIDPPCNIGHLQLMVSEVGPDGEARHLHLEQWRKENQKFA